MYEIRFILASGSPRRLELMEQLGYKPQVIKPNFEERRLSGESVPDYLRRNVEGKLESVASSVDSSEFFIISADTVVTQEGFLFEKPKDTQEARQMLENFSGTAHEVITAYLLGYFNKAHMRSDYQLVTTRVNFRKLSSQEIERYINSGEPFDKAGAYGIQGAASSFVDKIEGSYTNVVGLPLSQLQESIYHLLGRKD